jgi:sporulation protein YlmC with PRC-barrel domain
MDFTHIKYEELCKAMVDSNCAPVSVRAYLETQPERCIIIRHDVDRKPERAQKMAKVEHGFGITATYYFRINEDVFIPGAIKEIANMGHEIGYHYEVMDKAKGDIEKAIKIFGAELREFRKICDVKTICMHGNPLSKWVNRDLWTEYNFVDFGILGEPYLSIDYTKVLYLTDTGRRWNSRFSVKDVVGENSRGDKKVKSTDDVIRMIDRGHVNRMCILAHPERWSDGSGAWLKELVWQNVKNVGKVILVKRSSSMKHKKL